MKYFILSTLLYCSTFIFGQNVVFEAPMEILSVGIEHWKSYTHIDTASDKTSHFIFSRDRLEVFHLDKKFHQLKRLDLARNLTRQNKFLGNTYTPSTSTHRLFFTNLTKRKYCVTTINVESGKDTTVTTGIDISNDVFVSAGCFNQLFFLLTLKQGTSIVSLHLLDEQNNIKISKHDFSKHKFSGTAPFTLSSVLTGVDVNTFEPNNPANFINNISAFNQYISNNILYFTLDNSSLVTKVLYFDLVAGTSGIKVFKHEKTEGEGVVSMSSYLFKEHLYHIKSVDQVLYFSVYDIKKDSLVFRRKASAEQNELTNSAFIESGGLTGVAQGDYDELTMNAFLRKTYQLRIVAEDFDQINIKIRIGDYYEATGSNHTFHTMAGGGMTSMTSSTYKKNIRTVSAFILLDPITHQRISSKTYGSLLDKINTYSAGKKFFIENITPAEKYCLYSYYDKSTGKFCTVKY